MSWSEWLNGILGLWVILASYLYVPSGGARVVMFVTGLVIAVLGFWGGATEPHYEGASRQQIQH
ncbi:MAG TPA: SPW repeat protein [Candidatus Limnocylindria bacterium]|nr:SPW repeat protein [Candidatus Limnocylindria bacterium]